MVRLRLNHYINGVIAFLVQHSVLYTPLGECIIITAGTIPSSCHNDWTWSCKSRPTGWPFKVLSLQLSILYSSNKLPTVRWSKYQHQAKYNYPSYHCPSFRQNYFHLFVWKYPEYAGYVQTNNMGYPTWVRSNQPDDTRRIWAVSLWYHNTMILSNLVWLPRRVGLRLGRGHV